MIYRLFRKVERIEYQDIEANSEEEATKHYTDSINNFIVISDGGIVDWFVTTDFKNSGVDLFIKKSLIGVKDGCEK